MIKMIKLEWKKNNMDKCARSALVMTGILLILFLVMIAKMKREGVTTQLYNKSILCISIELFANMSYIVFTGIMLASFIVSGYKNKTIYLTFSYPIKRQKILLAQILSVWTFNLVALIITKFLAYGILCFVGRSIDVDVREIDFSRFSFYLQVVISSIIMISICFIALLVGVKMKSSKITIVSSVILACFTQVNTGAYTLADNLAFYVILLTISIISLFLTIYNIDKIDI